MVDPAQYRLRDEGPRQPSLEAGRDYFIDKFRSFYDENWGEYRIRDQVAPEGVYLNPITGSKYRGAPMAVAARSPHEYDDMGINTGQSYPPNRPGRSPVTSAMVPQHRYVVRHANGFTIITTVREWEGTGWEQWAEHSDGSDPYRIDGLDMWSPNPGPKITHPDWEWNKDRKSHDDPIWKYSPKPNDRLPVTPRTWPPLPLPGGPIDEFHSELPPRPRPFKPLPDPSIGAEPEEMLV